MIKNPLDFVRKGPHKSAHCKLCRDPASIIPLEEKISRSMLETRTKLNLVHDAAQLKVLNTYIEPGEPAPDSVACICKLATDPPPCPKCAPDYKIPPPKKRVCKCPAGAIPMEEISKPVLVKINSKQKPM